MTTTYFFQVVDPQRVEYTPFTANTASTLCNGVLAKNNYDGTLDVATASDKPSGFVQDNRFNIYRPTDIYAAAGEPVTLISGHVQAMVGKEFFVGATLPTGGADLYSAAGGLMDTTGTNAIGHCIKAGVDDIRATPNTSANVVLIECHFGAKDI